MLHMAFPALRHADPSPPIARGDGVRLRSRLARARAVVACAILAASAACASDALVAPSSDACYAIALGAWNELLPEALPPLPAIVQLTDSMGSQVLENGRRVIVAMPVGTPKPYLFQWWEPRGGDEVRLVFSTGFTGITIDATPQGTAWSGTARAFYDFGSYDLHAPATLARTSCP
jgi:hypothetical protein